MTLELGQVVYLKTDKEQNGRIITGICYRQTGVLYNLMFGLIDSWHYELELSVERDIMLATTN